MRQLAMTQMVAPSQVQHSPSDESLFQDLKVVVNAPQQVISRVIGARPKQDRDELKRILSHLPVVSTGRTGRPIVVAPPLAQASARGTSRGGQSSGGGPREVPPRTPRGDTPRTPHGLITRLATPRAASAAPSAAAAVAPSPREPTPQVGGPRAFDQFCMPPQGSGAPNERLAELGIDPSSMSANDILRQYYARRTATTQGMANSEADRGLNKRAQTPRSFDGVFTSRAHQEVRHARSAPVTHVHTCLDKWEIDVLADVCRSIRHYDDESRGATSEYMRHFAKKVYGSVPDRKRIVRKPV